MSSLFDALGWVDGRRAGPECMIRPHCPNVLLGGRRLGAPGQNGTAVLRLAVTLARMLSSSRLTPSSPVLASVRATAIDVALLLAAWVRSGAAWEPP